MHYLRQSTEAAPLAVFRIFFGLMMFISILRFWSYGWIDKLYIQPRFFFSYYGFEFVRPIGVYTYLIFVVCATAALLVLLGYYYRIAIICFFLSFTYIELMDKTTYLNHYYFISVLSFVMIFLPANAYFSLDARRNPELAYYYVPRWTIDVIKFIIAIVYFYAGLAKINSDWLLKAMPLKIWLPAHYDLPLIGNLLEQSWVHYTFSWGGMLYDLCIPFLLLWKRSRMFAFTLVIFFHVITRVLFPIGMFPYIMIVSTLIFFEVSFHQQIISFLSKALGIRKPESNKHKVLYTNFRWRGKLQIGLISAFLIFQLIFPFRYLLYPGELFWTEEGYRFSWRVMLMEKAGYANFKIVDAKTAKRFYVNNADFLTPFQEKQMATQPDFILEYAHMLKEHFESQGHQNIEVYVESYVALNGRPSRSYINPEVNLIQYEESLQPKPWILPFHDEIKGL